MIRKLILSSIAIVAMTLGALAPSASAQTDCNYAGCIAYPDGGFGSSAATAPTPTPRPTSSAVASADNVEATSGGSGSGNAIAFTGSESKVLGYAGAGLIGFGAIALVVARRKTEGDIA